MAFMEPYTYHGAYWRVETANGDYVIPAEDVGIDADHETLSAYAPEGVGPIDAEDIESAQLARGWYGRYSANGYLDCTEWEAADSEEELLSTLRDLYGDNDSEESAS